MDLWTFIDLCLFSSRFLRSRGCVGFCVESSSSEARRRYRTPMFVVYKARCWMRMHPIVLAYRHQAGQPGIYLLFSFSSSDAVSSITTQSDPAWLRQSRIQQSPSPFRNRGSSPSSLETPLQPFIASSLSCFTQSRLARRSRSKSSLMLRQVVGSRMVPVENRGLCARMSVVTRPCHTLSKVICRW